MEQTLNVTLRQLGAVAYDLWLPETHALPSILDPQEQIEGIVYGGYSLAGGPLSRGAIVVTNQRVLLLDKKPLFMRCDEIIFRAISGVTYSKIGLIGVVTLHTRQGDIKLRTYNQKCARHFVEAVETSIFNNRANNHAYTRN